MPDWLKDAGAVASWLLKLALLAMAVVLAANQEWIMAVSALVALAVSLAPTLVRRDLGVTTPWLLDFLITLMLILHIGGLFAGVYDRVPMYDRVLHAAASGLIAAIALLAGYVAHKFWDGFRLESTTVLAFFILFFTLAMGAVWELGEFASDQVLGTNNQPTLTDTMMDLVWDATAGLVVAVGGAVAIRRGWVDGVTDAMGRDVRRLQDGGRRRRGGAAGRGDEGAR